MDRLAAGEAFDVMMFADEVMCALASSGNVAPQSRVPLVISPVAAAVRAGAPLPDVASEPAVRSALLTARAIGYSSGPSGNRLLRLFARWGLEGHIRRYGVVAPAGTPVASLLLAGAVDLGFQQHGELLRVPGIAVAGVVPPHAELATVFVAGLTPLAKNLPDFSAFCALLQSPGGARVLREGGLAPVANG